MTEEQTKEITDMVNDSLDQAEEIWGQVGHEVTAKAALAEADESILNRARKTIPSQLPGHEFIEDGRPLVDEFIAMVLDMRESSKHLKIAIANKQNVSLLKRVYFETAAILPACSKTIGYDDGNVTEYLGDGLLAFFRVEEKNSKASFYAAHRAAQGCMTAMREIINPILNSRYDLPPVHIGIGMAVSKAIITVMGHGNFVKPTAFGICVFNASKLSKGNDEVIVDSAMEQKWPTAPNGTLRFLFRRMDDIDGYLLPCH
jgi:class 3 adenylate cyclase